MKKNQLKGTSFRTAPIKLLLEIARKYFRLETIGAQYIPRRGAGILAPNHSGFSGFDAVLLSNEVSRITGKLPRILTHRFWFLSNLTGEPAKKLGFIKATKENGLKNLAVNNLIILFPEGESGNFKPSLKRYHLQKFKHGFIRMALEKQCPIIPVLIIGAEETHINLARLKLPKIFHDALLPLPFNLVPLPAKWTIHFLPPIHLPYEPAAQFDKELVHEIAEEIREQMQRTLSEEVKKRPSIF